MAVKKTLTLCLLLLAFAFPLWGQEQKDDKEESKFRIKDLEIMPAEKREHVQLTFSKPFEGSPSYFFDPGVFQAIFPHTTFEPSLDFIKVNDQFIREVRLLQEGKNAILEIRFADAKFNAAGRIKNDQVEHRLHFYILKVAPALAPEPEKGASSLFTDGPSPSIWPKTAQEDFYQDDFSSATVIKMLVALVLVLALLYFMLWAYNRYFVSRLSGKKGQYGIQVSSSYHLSPKQKIIIVEVNKMAFACGITPNQISVISKVSDDSFVRFLAKVRADNRKEIDFDDLRAEYHRSRQEAKKKKAKATSPRAARRPQFAQELVERVKKLKPIE